MIALLTLWHGTMYTISTTYGMVALSTLWHGTTVHTLVTDSAKTFHVSVFYIRSFTQIAADSYINFNCYNYILKCSWIICKQNMQHYKKQLGKL